MGIIGPFPATGARNKNIIVAVDYLSKWVDTRAISTAAAKDAAELVMKDIILCHGSP